MDRDSPDTADPAGSAGLPGSVGRQLMPQPLVELDDELGRSLRATPTELNAYGFDPYGFHPDTARRMLLTSALLYRYYFRVETYDIENVPEGPVLLIGNHSGQFAYDGSMLSMAMLLRARPPRLCRGMAEFVFWKTPWAGTLASRLGMMAGTPENCLHMLNAGECVMVFPEGARGANKPFRKRYQLQRFGLGFMRLALESRTPIVPVGIVGAEEQQPGFANLEGLAERIGLPSFPITISMPWFGLLGPAFALPVKYHIHFGEPLVFEGDPGEEDALVQQKVDRVKDAISALLQRGLAQREGIFA
ncbi:MAG: lysophospholipid acyltransferase family protein [Myxococcota bacterium]